MEAKREYAGSRKIRKGSSKTPSNGRNNAQNSRKKVEKQSPIRNVRHSGITIVKKKSLNNTQKTTQLIYLNGSPEITQELSDESSRYSFSTEIPKRYNETYITVIAKDPNWLYMYWEFSDNTLKLINTMIDQYGSKLVLRLKDTETEDSFEKIIPFHIETNNGQGNRYLKVPEDGRVYLIECGYLSKQGDFFHIAQSDPVSVPALEPKQLFFDTPVNTNCNETQNATLTDSFNTNDCSEKRIPLNSYSSEICSALSSQYPGSA